MEERKDFKILTVDNIKQLVKLMNELSLTKDDIVYIAVQTEQIILIYQ